MAHRSSIEKNIFRDDHVRVDITVCFVRVDNGFRKKGGTVQNYFDDQAP